MGYFDKITDREKQIVLEIVSKYHYRTGSIQEDGSMGDVKITHDQLRDELAFVIYKIK